MAWLRFAGGWIAVAILMMYLFRVFFDFPLCLIDRLRRKDSTSHPASAGLDNLDCKNVLTCGPGDSGFSSF